MQGALARAGRIQDAIAAAQTAGESSWGLIGDIAAIAAGNGDAAAATAVTEFDSRGAEPAAVKVCEVWGAAAVSTTPWRRAGYR